MSEVTGARIGHYVIEAPLGAGGMGEVYIAYDERLERRVALKLLPASRALDQNARGRMLREARAASALRHPSIVTIHEIGEDGDRTFIVMELVEGETFAQLLSRRGPLPPSEAIRLVARVAAALHVAHEAGFVHRDVKSANLMVDERGEVKVLDFGLSKRLGGSESSPSPASSSPSLRAAPIESLSTVADGTVDPQAPTATPQPSGGFQVANSDDPITMHGARMGTPGSAAPELMRGHEADRRADVFSLGVVLYELVTGKLPFRGGTWAELEERIEAGTYEPASKVTSGAVDRRFDDAIARALQPVREARWATVAELIAAVEAPRRPAVAAPWSLRPRWASSASVRSRCSWRAGRPTTRRRARPPTRRPSSRDRSRISRSVAR